MGSIEGLPKNGVAVYRGAPEKTTDFCEALRVQLQGYPYGQCVFDNLDVSNVQWDSLNFSLLMDILQENGISTKRLKAFKCSLDDDALRSVAQWLEKLQPEGMPQEVHLSHNKITQAGFDALFAVLEAKRAQLPRPIQPPWVRVEQTQVSVQYLASLVAAGKISPVQRINARMPGTQVMAMPSQFFPGDAHKAIAVATAASSTAAASRVTGVMGGWTPQQSQAAGTQGKGNATRMIAPGFAHSQSPVGSAKGVIPPGACKGSTPVAGKGGVASVTTAMGGCGKGCAPAALKVGVVSAAASVAAAARSNLAAANASAAAGGGASRLGYGTADRASAADRSRTPGPRATKEPPAAAEEKLPPGWEKHWSEEFQIPYYWNVETEESLWEAPTA